MHFELLGNVTLPGGLPDPTHAGNVLRRAAHGALLALLASLAGCTGKSSAAPAPQVEPTPAATGVAAVPSEPKPASPASSNELQLGSAVPELPFTLQDGFSLDLPSLKGKLITVFFCPADNDPECVRQMHGLRARYAELHEQNHVVVLGVSPQDAATHKAFIAKNELPFDLVADVDGTLAKAFGVPAGQYTPRTFLVGKDGKIQRVWRTADPNTHIGEILALAHL